MKITIHKNSILIRATDFERSDSYLLDDYYNDADSVEEIVKCFPVGKCGTLAASYNHSPDSFRAGTDNDVKNCWLDSPYGVKGNSDHNIKSTSGWRGTTNDRAVYALGVIEIKSARKLARGYAYKITFKRILGE